MSTHPGHKGAPRLYLRRLLICAATCLSLPVIPALAIDKPHSSETKSADTDITKPKFTGRAALLPDDSVTHQTLTTGSKQLGYTAHAGTLTLRDDKGEPTARMFYVAYTLDGTHPERRPVSFFFNGGPGGGSAYLNLGAAGPVALTFPTGNPTDGANAKLGPNPDTWLAATDMVFIDAVGTGYSVPVKPETADKMFYGTKSDARAFAKAIDLWIGANDRHASPHYLVGESYGGVRSVEVATALQQQQNLILNGIIMVSPALEMKFLDPVSNPLAAAMLLPSFEASRLDLEHKLTPAAIDESYHYAFGSYLTTLAGAPPAGDDAHDFYGDVAHRTGLDPVIVARERGMPDPQAHDVRSRNGRLFSLYDGTLSIADPFPEGIDNGDSPEPVLFGFGRAYGNAFEGYATQTLRFRTELTYDLLDLKVNSAWDYRGDGELIAGETPQLRKLLALNPTFRVFIANGYFDLVCPFASSRWVAEHVPVGRDRISLHVYPGGHMLYTRPASRAALARDVRAFLTP
ncbi:S10 family peptidase [Acetobacter oeni]|uniref:Carboxypeptidase-like protein n=1 Tax=Acetobacter oeni TaxID=304077 RepID=A0A511XNB9_9PROT|nr:peptidase S10 [Acetobacter oeni]MBB3884255.1 carboxypeptidase C (cathepsin A) [Acetobacter oeni]NHO20226.1 peptidase S10 [Acetobacter oeni]GBR06282.1 peptidase S10 serine carboxypeptidase [Acetobacter oeni LMG 21952]GEN64426.1 carboxypeptidase-like protein [Acetobacter oeni]